MSKKKISNPVLALEREIRRLVATGASSEEVAKQAKAWMERLPKKKLKHFKQLEKEVNREQEEN